MRFLPITLAALLAACTTSYPELDTLQKCPQPVEGGDHVKLTWLGVGGVFIDDGKTGLLIDPFVSRGVASVSRVAGGRDLHPELGKIREQVKALGPTPVEGILVTHSHFDHSMDAPDFARMADAPVYGSVTTRQIMLGNGLTLTQAKLVKTDEPLVFNGFKVEFQHADHAAHLGKNVVFWNSKLKNDPDNPPKFPAPASAYPMGQVYKLKITHRLGTILYYGSAGWEKPKLDSDGKEINPQKPIPGDVVSVLALGGRFDREGYVDEAVTKPDADMVIPTHFDNLFELPRKPERLLDRQGMRDFIEVLTRTRPQVEFMPIPRGKACAVLPLPKT